ncbi:LD-carboxypeptidase [Candidatus Cardinium hertigii]|jgi:muramoyltetrapeptide carboxypeptidase|uniref:LD-carboxypeptidase n=1 Tax=Candidatus Cardinium hertigii TaxID=247481 RepID=A0A3N2QB73_9BACT|nr:LD-carboxypeptidase [Candidatus Cardinium hertigii]ROT47057.1 LD-carboxypeptidase [Candidatus Cardinium hertigii]
MKPKNPVNSYHVDLIAPAYKAKSDLSSIQKYITDLELKPHISDTIYKGSDPMYPAPDKYRATDLIRALTSDHEIIWPLRGGQGFAALIPYLEKLSDEEKRKIEQNRNKKVLIGYSDITVGHTYLQNKYNYQTLHATMPDLIVEGPTVVSSDSVKKLEALIRGDQNSVTYSLAQINNGVKVKDEGIQSKIIGGNMTLIRDTMATPWQVNIKDRILFLEDVHESPERLERAFTHLIQTNVLGEADAVICGDFYESSDPLAIECVKERFAHHAPCPVFSVTGIGHSPINNPLPLNTHTTLRLEDEQEGLFTIEVENVDLFKKK